MGRKIQDMKKLSKICLICNEEFLKTETVSLRRWNDCVKYCSRVCMGNSKKGKPSWNSGKKGVQIAWNKGKTGLQVAWNKGNGEYAKKLGFGKWMQGKTQSVETRIKKSEAAKATIARGEHNFYIDGRTPENKRIRHSVEYKLWREAVFKRDDWTCQECGVRGAMLNADHIKPFAFFPELRFDTNNGRTLCVPCHAETPTYKGRALAYSK